MKLAVNSVIAVINEAIAEGLVLAERAGIASEDAYDVFSAGAVAAPYVLYKRDAFLSPEETPVAFTVALMRKDLELAFESGGERRRRDARHPRGRRSAGSRGRARARRCGLRARRERDPGTMTFRLLRSA